MAQILKNVIGTYLYTYIINLYNPYLELSSTDESRVACASTALLSLLRSWAGLLHISNPALPTKPLQSLVDILHIQTHQARKISYETRKLILNIIFKSLNLQVTDLLKQSFYVCVMSRFFLIFRLVISVVKLLALVKLFCFV